MGLHEVLQPVLQQTPHILVSQLLVLVACPRGNLRICGRSIGHTGRAAAAEASRRKQAAKGMSLVPGVLFSCGYLRV
jgi:hypothetical protein